jgi:hypothetical protein
MVSATLVTLLVSILCPVVAVVHVHELSTKPHAAVHGGHQRRKLAYTITQIGSDITGEGAADSAASTGKLSLSRDGLIMAVGAGSNDGTAADAGHVRVYEYQTSGGWTQMGSDIDGEAASDYFGVVSLSKDGTRVAVGASYNDGTGSAAGHVRVYQWSGSAWTQMGNDIDGEAAGDEFGSSVSINQDGSRVAIGAPQNDGGGTGAGSVRVYEWSGSAWQKMGSDIDGESASDNSGSGVAISPDGSRVAIGAPQNGNIGHVRVYEWDGSAWGKVGGDIDGEANADMSGKAVSLDYDGTVVAIGAHRNNNDAGHVRVYQWSGSAWTQMGADVDGTAASTFGQAVSLSEDGNYFAAGARAASGGGSSAGAVRVFKWTGAAGWVQMGADIQGGAGNYFGESVSMTVRASDHNIVVAGGAAAFNSNRGRAQAYLVADPHLQLAHGGTTDFRGRDNVTYNVLSAPNISLGLRVTESHFMQKWRDNPDCKILNNCDSDTNLQTVNGSHFTSAYFVLRSHVPGHLLHVTISADVNPWHKPWATVEPIGFDIPEAYAKYTYPPRRQAKAIKLATDQASEFVHEGLTLHAPNNHRVTVEAAGWLVNVTRRRLFKPLPDSKTNAFLDVTFAPVDAHAHGLAHGLIGQSFSFNGPRVDGRKDDYSKPEVTTSAQAEGAIEGVGSDYMLSSEFDVRFKYSRFDSTASAIGTAFARDAGTTEVAEAAEVSAD